MFRGGYPPYVSAKERKKKAEKVIAQMQKKGEKVTPVRIEGRIIAKTFWGKSWCQHLESFSDYENRLPRGRTYARNGSVIHLKIATGKIEALVQGSSLYEIHITIKDAEPKRWKTIIGQCSGEIDSVIELLQGKLSTSVMKTISNKESGLFPKPSDISLGCSCPDWAGMCKHVAAVLYGVGARLDEEPELLFKLRNVNHLDLIHSSTLKVPHKTNKGAPAVSDDELSNLFGIDLDMSTEVQASLKPQKARMPITVSKEVKAKKVTAKKVTAKKAIGKKVTAKKAIGKKLAGKKLATQKTTRKTASVKVDPVKKAKVKSSAKKTKSPVKKLKKLR